MPFSSWTTTNSFLGCPIFHCRMDPTIKKQNQGTLPILGFFIVAGGGVFYSISLHVTMFTICLPYFTIFLLCLIIYCSISLYFTICLVYFTICSCIFNIFYNMLLYSTIRLLCFTILHYTCIIIYYILLYV